jgi:anti-sigma factor RsiW
VKPSDHDRHLSAELLQGFLDGVASPREAARVQEHTASCARCRSELEAWRTLFGELGALADVAPSPAFRERVLQAVPAGRLARASVADRFVRWLGRALGRRPEVPAPALLHPAAESLQDFLEGLLPRAEALGIEGHLHGCRDCRREVDDWRRVITRLEGLPRLEPTPELSERVMAHVRVQLALSTATPTLAERLQLLVASVTPRTRRRVAALAGAGVTPAVTLGLLAYAVFSHPLVTLGNLLSFVWLQGSERVSVVGSGVLERTTESEAVFRAYQALEVVFASPGTAALAVTGLAGLTLTAIWVLYRNVLVGHSNVR